MLAPDSGAGSVAALDVDVTGGEDVVTLLGPWGGAQLLKALVVWTVLARYRGLVPLMLAGAVVEALLGSLTPLSAGRGSTGRTERR